MLRSPFFVLPQLCKIPSPKQGEGTVELLG